MQSCDSYAAIKNFSILFTEDQICISYEIAPGNRRMGYCNMLKIIIVKKAFAAEISFPNEIYVKNVKDTIIGGQSQYKNMVAT